MFVVTETRIEKAPVDLGVVSIARGMQRAFDVVIASIALVVLSPLMLVIAMAIYLESGRPIFFSHRRVGQYGKPFSIYKFRKFGRDCSANGLQLTLEHDPRFTRVGRVLARTKLDELPQFVNVLKGEMSIVGPRPESLRYLDCFAGDFAKVLAFRPGIFGPSQVQFRHENTLYPENGDVDAFYRSTLFPEKAGIDLSYYPSRTMTKDIGWLLRGFCASLRSK